MPSVPVDAAVSTGRAAEMSNFAGSAAVSVSIRHRLSAERFPLELHLGHPRAGSGTAAGDRDGPVIRPRAFSVYLSRHGVLGPPGERALRLLGQEQLFGRLAAECRDFGRVVRGVPRQAMRALSLSAELRASSRRAFRSAGWVLPAGLD